MKHLAVLILTVGSVALLQAAPARPVQLDKAAADAAVKEIEKDRVDTKEWLKSSNTSYLATVDRLDFEDKKTLTVGRASDNNLRIDTADFAQHHLQVTVVGDQFHVVAVDPGAQFKVEKDDKREATLDPSMIQVGRFMLRLSHQRYPGIIVFDPQSHRFKEYKGIEYFPIDLSYRYELPLTPNPKPETIVILSTRGNKRNAVRVGWFEFMVGDTPAKLEAVRLLEPGVGEDDISILFRDATSGKESYELGRYVDAKKLPNGRYLLDFNFTYNPACAYSEHYNCPIPPKDNTLTVAIRAGERDGHYFH